MNTCGFQSLIYLPSGKIHVNPGLDTYSISLEITKSEKKKKIYIYIYTHTQFFCNFQKKSVYIPACLWVEANSVPPSQDQCSGVAV